MAVIQNTPGAIGYVNQSYIKGNVKAAALQNLSGEFLKPSAEAGAKALNGITLDENLAGKNPIQQQKERTLSLHWHGYLLTKKVMVETLKQ